jgi:predicted MFS family arabinose efflux permease
MHTDKPAHAPSAERAILLLAAAAFVSGANLRVADPLVPTLANHFATSASAAASVVSAFTLSYALFQIVHGPLGDRVGKLRVVAAGMFMAAVASIACALAPNLTLLAIGRFLTGMGAAAVIPLALAFIGDNVPYERRQMMLGRFMASVLTGQMLGPLFAGALSEFLSWRAIFVLLALVFAGVGFLLLPGARRSTGTAAAAPANPLRQYAALARDRWVRVVVLTVAIEGFLFYGAFAYLGAYLHDDFGLTYFAIGLVIAGFSIGGVVFSFSVKWLVPRLRERGLALAGGVVLLLCYAGLAATPWWTLAVPLCMASGLGFYMLHNTLQTKATEMAPAARGAAVSFFAFCLFLGQAGGVAAFGQGVEQFGYRAVMGAAGIGLCVLAWWFSLRLARQGRKAAAGDPSHHGSTPT